MSTSITKAEQNALSVSYEVLGNHVELDLDFVKNYLVRGKPDLVTNQEVLFFMHLCKMQRLNPLVGGEVYLIKYNKDDPAQTVVGKGAYMRRMFEHPEYLCKDDGIVVEKNGEIIKKEGCCIYPGEALIGGWCRIHFMRNNKEREAYKEVSLEEYNKNMANWKSRPATMINKVAISQCAREAFPSDYEGMYSEDEMIASGAIPTNEVVINPDSGEVVDRPVTQEQRQKLFQVVNDKFGAEGNDILKSLLSEHGLETTANMSVSVLEAITKELAEIYAAKGNDK